jgi:hypothetical protein
VLKRLARIEQEIINAHKEREDAAETTLPLIADLRRYMTTDEVRKECRT